MRVETPFIFLSILPFLAGTALAQQPSGPMSRNTIDCNDWTHNQDGSWQPHDNEKPFDLGSSKGATILGDATYPNSSNVGGVDLWTALTQKCGTMR